MNATADEVDLATAVPRETMDSQQPQRLSEKEFLVIWIIFGIIWGCSIIANLFSAVSLGRTKKTPLTIIIIGLCGSDIVSAFTSPFIVGQIVYSGAKKEYPWNVVICKTAIPMGSVTCAVTIQLVFALSIWRLNAIRRPQKAIGFMTLRRAKQVVVFAWMISTVIFLPLGAYFLDIVNSSFDPGKQICFTTNQTIWIAEVYNFVDALIMNLIPTILIFMLCVAIGFSLIRRKMKRHAVTGDNELRKDEKQALIQLTLIIATFLIGYLPKLFHIISYNVGYGNQRVGTISYLVSRGLLNSTEFLNPLVYNLSSSDLRSSTKHILQHVFCIWRHSREKRNGNSVEMQCDE